MNRKLKFDLDIETNARVAAVVGAAATDGGNRTMSAANLLDFISDAACGQGCWLAQHRVLSSG